MLSHINNPSESNPVLVDVYRKDIIESRHCGSVIVVNNMGETVFSLGDVGRSIYPRSSIKFFQAIPLVESGAVDQFGVTDAELALSCASHIAEPRHTETVKSWLARMQLSVADLENGRAMPQHKASRISMYKDDQGPTKEHHTCSGKHTGMLTMAKSLGLETRGYSDHEHGVQKNWMQTYSELIGINVAQLPWERDGCGLPAICMPMKSLAFGCALYASPDAVGGKRAEAMKRVASAIASNPLMVAGTGKCCSDVIAESNGAVFAKTGAEGVYIAVLREQGLGVALKIDDGATRASEVALGAILAKLNALDPEVEKRLEKHFRPLVKNSQGKVTGQIQPSVLWD
jgi:L-asparaginase II